MKLASVVAALALVIGACGSGEGELGDLQLVGVDFELNSVLIYNLGASEVRTEGLSIYRDSDAFELDIFTIEPRTTVLFNMRELGPISVSHGEIALIEGADLSDTDALLQYVAWGDDPRVMAANATEAGLWPAEGTVATEGDTLVLIRTDPSGNNPESWEASDEVG